MTKCTVIQIVERSGRGRTGKLPLKSGDMSRAVWCFVSRLLNSGKRKKHRRVLQFPQELNLGIATEQQKGNNS